MELEHGYPRDQIEDAALDIVTTAIARGYGFVVIEIPIENGQVQAGGRAVMSIGQTPELKHVTANTLLKLSRALAREL